MKMPDGGFRPADNAQFVSDTETQVAVGVDAVAVGTDMGQLSPMIEQVGDRVAVETYAVLYSGDMADKAAIVFAEFDASGKTAVGHGVHGLIPACSRKLRASRIRSRLASLSRMGTMESGDRPVEDEPHP